MDVSISAFRACAGGYVGGQVHPALLDAAREGLAEAKETELVADGFVARCGDDIDLVLMQHQAQRSHAARDIALDVFGRAASAGARLRQHGNGGIHVEGTELVFVPRSSEPVLCLFSNKARTGAWNLYLYRMFADPFNTPGLTSDPALMAGFRFTADADWIEDTFDLPADLHRLIAELGAGACVCEVRSRGTGELAAVCSTGADPVAIVRCETPFPGVEDVLEAFTTSCAPGVVGECVVVPVSANSDASTRSVPRAVGLGFQVTPDRLVGPRDLFGDSSFDETRRQAMAVARQLRRGPVGAPAELGYAPQR